MSNSLKKQTALRVFVNAINLTTGIESRPPFHIDFAHATAKSVKRILTLAFKGADGIVEPQEDYKIEAANIDPIAFDLVNHIIKCLGRADRVWLPSVSGQAQAFPSQITRSSLFKRMESLCALFLLFDAKGVAPEVVPTIPNVGISIDYKLKSSTQIFFKTTNIFAPFIGNDLMLVAPVSNDQHQKHGLVVQRLNFNASIIGIEVVNDDGVLGTLISISPDLLV